MRTFLIVLLTALLTLIGGGVVLQEGLIPGLGGGECKSTQIVKTYEEGACPENPIKETGDICTTPWGTTVTHGGLVLSFDKEEGTFEDECVSKTSICNDGSYLDGNDPYDYEKCMYSEEAIKQLTGIDGETCDPEKIEQNNCTVNGFIFAEGTTKKFYTPGKTVNGKRSCSSQERTCEDGVASGDDTYIYLSCHGEELAACLPEEEVVVEAPKPAPKPTPVVRKTTPVVAQPTEARQPNCPNPFGGYRWEPGQTGTAYKASSVPHGSTCEQVSLVCAYGSVRYGTTSNPGAIVGGDVAQACSVLPPNPCSSACGTVGHGESVTTYSQSRIPFGNGQTCDQVAVISTCSDGVLSPGAGSSCGCEIAPANPCVAPNGQTVAHESSLTLYQASQIQAVPGDGSDTCVRQWRQCINGTFHDWNGNPASFTYRFPTCEVIEPPAGGGPGGDGIPVQ